MTGGDGDVSPPAPLHVGTGLISGFSAVPGGAGGGNVRRSMKRGKEPALAGGSSTATMGSPPPSSKSLKCREAEAEGGKKKRKKAVSYASGESTSCSLRGKQFKNRQERCGHMRIHNNQPHPRDNLSKQRVHEEQNEELAWTLQNLRQKAEAEGGKKKRKKAASYASGMSTSCSLCGKKFKSRQARCGHMRVHNNQPRRQDNPPKPQVHEEQNEEFAWTLQNLWQKAEAEGGKEKRKKAASYASGMSTSCSLCGKQFKNRQPHRGHMGLQNNQPQRRDDPPKQQVHGEQDEELAWTLLNLGERTLNKMEGRETKGDGSAVAEGGTSWSAAEAQRKKIHMKLDLNKDAPEDDENDDEDYGGGNKGA